jgi:hypothetical protein
MDNIIAYFVSFHLQGTSLQNTNPKHDNVQHIKIYLSEKQIFSLHLTEYIPVQDKCDKKEPVRWNLSFTCDHVTYACVRYRTRAKQLI